LTCASGSHCTLDCTPGAQCAFTCNTLLEDCHFNCEGGTPIDCGNNTQVCHYDACP
jgi:hypothetical protein